jgi:disulfide bond formation protein DsbB
MATTRTTPTSLSPAAALAFRVPPRALFAAIAAFCLASVLTAIFYFQGQLGLEPCPLCIVSRMTFMAIGTVALIAAIHGPTGVGLKVYGGLLAALAVAGVGVSIRHSWIQHNPPKFESCGADFDFILNTMPLAQALPRIFSGTGSCSKVDWSFLALSIPEWAGLAYLGIFAAALWVGFVRPRIERS